MEWRFSLPLLQLMPPEKPLMKIKPVSRIAQAGIWEVAAGRANLLKW